jgi:hypothetical protein
LKQIFCEVYEEKQEKAHLEAILEAILEGKRTKEMGGGRKSKLPAIEAKVLFLLYYFEVYPTFDVLASTFNMARSRACENVHKLALILYETLFRAGFLPHRSFESVEEFKQVCEGIDRIIIDVTERKHERPQDNEKQAEMYSGKKNHTVKNTVISTVNKVIIFVGQTVTGHNHDYKMLKTEFPPDKPWYRFERTC